MSVLSTLQISPNFRTAITVPHQSWEKFVQLVEKAMEEKKSTATAPAESTPVTGWARPGAELNGYKPVSDEPYRGTY